MDIYTTRSRIHVAFIVLGLLLLAVTVVYSSFLAEQLREKEEKDAKQYLLALQQINNNPDLNASLELEGSILTSADIQLVYQYDDGTLEGMNWGEENDTSQVFLETKVQEYLASGKKPLDLVDYRGVYPFNSKLMGYIRNFPVIQALLVVVFILLTYVILNSSRNAEQNRVWAGMAKETAHQLGTPISAIMGWIEHMKVSAEGDEEQLQIVHELTKDVERLELVADRFSKIGSAPELVETDINAKLCELHHYMKRRSSKHIHFDFPDSTTEHLVVKINAHLFDWVIENLIRNALDAMDGKGTITARSFVDGDHAVIELSDTGKGIASSKFKTIFKPGYTTKSRGWGLGLSLSKRIIETYHKGKIFVKQSKLNEGTTFTIKLPLH